MLPVGHIAKAVGWINSLMLLIFSNRGISGMGVPWSRKQNVPFCGGGGNPVITVSAHKGMAIP